MTTIDLTSVTEEQLLSWYWQLSPIHGDLLQRQLHRSERERRGGRLQPLGPGLVFAAAEGISERPHLFPDAPAPGPDLVAGQKIAYGWLLLRDRLQMMAGLAADAYLATQTQLTGMVMPFVLANMKKSDQAPISEADLSSRNLAL